MAKLTFTYAAMNSSKSLNLLAVRHNYIESGMNPIVGNFKGDDRFGESKIASRAGLECKVDFTFDNETIFKSGWILEKKASIIIIDEAQFLTKAQVLQLVYIVDNYNIPVMCYGLRSDFLGELFEGSATLLAYADKIKELKTLCFNCGEIARFNKRLVESKEQVVIGGNDVYKPVCRKCFLKGN